MRASVCLTATVLIAALGACATVVAPMRKCEPMPTVVHSEFPNFPTKESYGAGGTVTLEFTIRTDGSVSDPIIVGSDTVPSKDWFNAAALESIVNWKFSPVQLVCRGRTAITFKLTD